MADLVKLFLNVLFNMLLHVLTLISDIKWERMYGFPLVVHSGNRKFCCIYVRIN